MDLLEVLELIQHLLKQVPHALGRLDIRDGLELELREDRVQLLLKIKEARLDHGDLLDLQRVIILDDFELLLLLSQLLSVVLRLVDHVHVVGNAHQLLIRLLLQLDQLLLEFHLLVLQVRDRDLLLQLLLLQLFGLLDNAGQALEVYRVVNTRDLRNLLEVVHINLLLLIDKGHTDLEAELPVLDMLPPSLQIGNGFVLLGLGRVRRLTNLVGVALRAQLTHDDIVQAWRLLLNILSGLHQFPQFLAEYVLDLLLLCVHDLLNIVLDLVAVHFFLLVLLAGLHHIPLNFLENYVLL